MTVAHAPHDAVPAIERAGARVPSPERSAPAAARNAAPPSAPRVSRILDLQRSAGNRAVVQRLSNAGLIAQRAPGDEPTEGGATPTPAGAGGGTEINDTSVKITAGMIELNAPMVRVGGVAQTDTLLADSVIASTYSPGAGNIW